VHAVFKANLRYAIFILITISICLQGNKDERQANPQSNVIKIKINKTNLLSSLLADPGNPA